MRIEGLENVVLPQMYRVKQHFPDLALPDIPGKIREEMSKTQIREKVAGGKRVAIAVGSRGINNIALIVKSVVEEVKNYGGRPFIVPAMGSHGGATAEGQKQVLESYGITEEYTGAPIISSMEVVSLGKTDQGVEVFMDKQAYGADAIIAINRIKLHTDFRGEIESGVLKLLAIGLGKHKGAANIHRYGAWGLKEHIPEVAKVMIKKSPVALGIGIVEDAYDHTAIIEAMEPEEIEEKEKRLLKTQRELMPSLPLDKIDVLIVEEMGKNISGCGMDTNVIGRIKIKGVPEPERPDIKVVVVLDLTEESHGNAVGIGLADLTTRRLVNKIDWEQMYANCITSTFPERGKIPVTLETDELAIKTAFMWIGPVRSREAKVIRIKNTLQLSEMYVSEACLEELKGHPNIELLEGPVNMQFDEGGNLR
ncbi:MAG: lactate racemase domain-containing protein [Moorellaceae bacterium]